jgi:hypothetical protein
LKPHWLLLEFRAHCLLEEGDLVIFARCRGGGRAQALDGHGITRGEEE